MSFPVWDRKRLEKTAREHAAALAWDHDDYDWDSSATNVDRLVVNMLRHEFTDYDNDQTQAHHRTANLAIATAFPWLAGECERQIERRAHHEEADAEFVAAVQEMERQAKEFKRQRSADSYAAIEDLFVGAQVAARIKGFDRTGTITKMGRNRVTMSYRLVSGAERTAVLYASEVKRLTSAKA